MVFSTRPGRVEQGLTTKYYVPTFAIVGILCFLRGKFANNYQYNSEGVEHD